MSSSRISGQRLISGKLPDIRLNNQISDIKNQPEDWFLDSLYIYGIQPDIKNGRISGQTGYPVQPLFLYLGKQIFEMERTFERKKYLSRHEENTYLSHQMNINQ